MERVVIKVKRKDETRVRELKVPATIGAARLASLIAGALGWESDEAGRPTTYRIEAPQLGRMLQPEETLADVGVADGSRLVLHLETEQESAPAAATTPDTPAEDDAWLQMFLASSSAAETQTEVPSPPQTVAEAQPQPAASNTDDADDPWLRMILTTPQAAESTTQTTTAEAAPLTLDWTPTAEPEPAYEPVADTDISATPAISDPQIAEAAPAAQTMQVVEAWPTETDPIANPLPTNVESETPKADDEQPITTTQQSAIEPPTVQLEAAPTVQQATPTPKPAKPTKPPTPTKGPVTGWRKIMDLPDAPDQSNDQPDDKPQPQVKWKQLDE